MTGGPYRPITHITDDLLRSVPSCDQQQNGDEDPLLVMLRSAGRAEVREQLRTQVCSGYVQDLTERLDGERLKGECPPAPRTPRRPESR
ncbi:hypothetical protein ABZ348_31375 [Streptomyces sp. NPDC005963]|uniref:hypothetical protein n=1 Tax=Streptomyces sp. NPDC005963 TaxID=3156721 RepID=UPI0034075B0E